MEGPTPVSALIHAATMVAAGVFLLARVYPLMAADFSLPNAAVHALSVVALVGAVTALLGAVLALAQTDLKRVLAYSTVSQLGYMMVALGVGAWEVAVFHLLTHAFFKALLFLGAGSVIHANHHQQDIRALGGLSRRMRVTAATFAIGSMALAGVPFIFSGFWSKEAILHAAHAWSGSPLPFWCALAAVPLTAFYSVRLVAEVFLGAGPRESHLARHPPRESSPVMTLPLGILSAGAIGLGFLGTPAWPWIQSRLLGHPVPAQSLEEGGGLTAIAIGLVAVGAAWGWQWYGRFPRKTVDEPDPLQIRIPKVFAALRAGLGIDRFYAMTLGRAIAGAAFIADGLDRWIWNGVVKLIAGFAELVGLTAREFDEDGLNGGFDRMSEGLRKRGQDYSRAQSGRVQGYLSALALAFAVLATILMAGGLR
jgi:NADH-quinone oxidoreductase subunit L